MTATDGVVGPEPPVLPPSAARRHRVLAFPDLNGWVEDDHAEALLAFRTTCRDIEGQDWAALGTLAQEVGPEEARDFFERHFRPVLIEDGRPTLFTGYYEPELDGDVVPSGRFQVPLYAPPSDARGEGPWPTRAQIEDGALAGQGLEIAWVESRADAFFLQVQGSGRIRRPDGRVMRLGYAGSNGHPYSSIGRALIARGALPPHDSSADAVKAWIAANPDEGAALLRTNASFVFFRELSDLPPEQGPLGAMQRPVTPLRSIAVDPVHVPLGAPVWIEKDGDEPMRRLMVAQDIGSAIKGAQRADIFFGTGTLAGSRAGRVRDGGRMVVLLPTLRALSLLSEVAAGEPPPAGLS